MKEKREIRYLDEEGYDKYIEEIKETRKELAKIKASKHDAYNATSSNSLGDNFDFEETERLEVMTLGKLKRLVEGLQDIVIVKEEEKKEDTVNLNDCVELSLYIKEEQEIEKFKLVAYRDANNEDEEYTSISLSSPIGRAIYGRKIGETIPYSVGNDEFKVKIETILREEDKKIKKSKKR